MQKYKIQTARDSEQASESVRHIHKNVLNTILYQLAGEIASFFTRLWKKWRMPSESVQLWAYSQCAVKCKSCM